MCNCNQQRFSYTTTQNQNTKGMVQVKLITKKSMVLNGDITGRAYVFRKINDINWVDKRDAIRLMGREELQLI